MQNFSKTVNYTENKTTPKLREVIVIHDRPSSKIKIFYLWKIHK